MKTTSDKIIEAQLMGRIGVNDGDRALDIALFVERHITCGVTGQVMDSRTALGLFNAGTFICAVDPNALDVGDFNTAMVGNPHLKISGAADVWEIIDS